MAPSGKKETGKGRGSKRRRTAGSGDNRDDTGNSDKSRSPIHREERPTQRPPGTGQSVPSSAPPATHSGSTGRGPPPPNPSAVNAFITEYQTVGGGNRLLFRLSMEVLAEFCRTLPPVQASPMYDAVSRRVGEWVGLNEEQRRAWLAEVEQDGGLVEAIEAVFASVRAVRPPGAVGLIFSLADDWPTTPQDLRTQFLGCLIDAPMRVFQVFLDLAEPTKDLLRRLG